MSEKEYENLGGVIPGILNGIDSEKQKRDLHRRLASANPHERVKAILEDIQLRTDFCAGSSSLEVDPRRDFQTVIDLAKQTGNQQFVEEVYTFIIDYYGKGRYYHNAALTALECGRLAQVWEFIDKLIEIRDIEFSNPDFRGTREIAAKIGPEAVAELERRILAQQQAQEKKNVRLIPQPYCLSSIGYTSSSDSTYKVNDSGFLFKNGVPLIMKPLLTVFTFIGIAEAKKMWDALTDYAIGSKYDNWRTTHVFYLIYQREHLVRPFSFEQVREHVNNENALIGINKERQEIFVSDPLVNVVE